MRVRRILKSERGNMATIMFLLLLPVLVLFMMGSLDHVRAVFGTDQDMQQAVNDACRSATMMVEPLSQAYNNPMVEPDNAHMAFRDILASNLGLEADMTPKAKSPFENIKYTLIVINGANDYGLPEGYKYSSEGVNEELTGTLPMEVVISDNSLDLGSGELTTTMDKPGCVAVISATLKPILGNQKSTGIRWSSAKILK